jgi:N4-gp56 family major capsid protein
MAGLNTSGQFTADIQNYIADEVLPLARRWLVVYQFGTPLTLPKGQGVTYTATRFERVPLPFAPLSEAIPPVGQTMTISQVTATAQQWGDVITISDRAELTTKHPVFQQGVNLMGLQIAETLERNTYVQLMGGTQINYVNTRGSRAALVAGDVLNLHEVNRAFGILHTLGAPRFMGDEQTNIKVKAEEGEPNAGKNARANPHFVAVVHPLVEQDMRENSSVMQAWSFSDINKIYNSEIGELGGVRFCRSNMVPSFVGVAQVNGVTGTAGSLATGTYYVRVTGSDGQNQYESRIYQVSTSVAVVGPNGSISVTLPTLAGFTFSVYVGLTTSPANLGTSVMGPLQGPYAGQATQLAGGQTVTITNTGIAQVPPAAPATGVTIYPTFIFGRGAYGQVMLDDVKTTFLKEADKSDPLNQVRTMGWKAYYGTLIENNTFFMRVESASAFSTTFG